MARGILTLWVVTMAASGCSLSSILPTAQACPAALLEGTLAKGPGGTAVVSWEFGEQAVRWPEGYVVEQEPELRLLDERGALVASEGDPISIGGGLTAGDELFIACGYVSSEPLEDRRLRTESAYTPPDAHHPADAAPPVRPRAVLPVGVRVLRLRHGRRSGR